MYSTRVICTGHALVQTCAAATTNSLSMSTRGIGSRRRFWTKAWPVLITRAERSRFRPRIGRSRAFRARVKNRRVVAKSRFGATRTSMTWPYWSIAQYIYTHRPATFTYVSSTNHRFPTTCRQGRAASISSGVNRCTQR
jgi:hypothetical protein